MIEADCDVDNSLKKRSVFSAPLNPDLFDDVVALEKVPAVEQRNTFFEFFSLRKYSKFRLNFQLKNLFPSPKKALNVPVFQDFPRRVKDIQKGRSRRYV